MTEPTGMQVDTALVRELAELLDATQLTEIEVTDGDRRIRVARKAAQVTGYAPAPPAPPPAGNVWAAAPAADPGPARRRRRPEIASRPGPLADRRHRLSDARPEQPAVHCRRQSGEGGRHAADHRGDEGDEPDHRAAAPAPSSASVCGTSSRSSTTNRWSSSNNVQQDPDCQPRRDRAPRPPRLPRARHQDGGGPFDRRRRRDACPHGRRGDLHRAAERHRQLSERPQHHLGRRDRAGRCDPSRLWLSQRERAVRRDRRGAQHRLDRADARPYPPHGRQDRGEAYRGHAGPAAGARQRRSSRDDRGGNRGRRPHRLPGAGQGGERRRRPRHEGHPGR